MTEIIHEATPAEHSHVVGGSSAGRLLNCPGSRALYHRLKDQLEATACAIEDQAAGLPADEARPLFERAAAVRGSFDESSKYADEGTGLHEIMAYIVDNDAPTNTLSADARIDELMAQYEIEDSAFFDAVLPAANAFDQLAEELELDDWLVENRVQIAEIDGAFGTSDVIAKSKKLTAIIDWKFGGGVPVYASYKQDGVEFGNDQLMYYAAGALHTFPGMFGEGDDWPVDLVIVQPRIHDEPQRFTTTVKALRNFTLDLQDAIVQSELANAHMQVGSHCRFAKCKKICPLHMNSAEAMASIGAKLSGLRDRALTDKDVRQAVTIIPPGEMEPQEFNLTPGQMYAVGLKLQQMLEPMLSDIAADAQRFMEAGGEVPGYKLVPKKAGWDKWQDDGKAEKFLGRSGVALEERRVVKPITPAAARKKLAAIGAPQTTLKALEKYVQPGVSSGNTLAPESDSRPAVLATPTLIRSLADKLVGSLQP